MAEASRSGYPSSRAFLEFPKRVDGVLWNEIHLARLSAGELRDLIERLTRRERPVPENVLDALDDVLALEEASRDFFAQPVPWAASDASTQEGGEVSPVRSARWHISCACASQDLDSEHSLELSFNAPIGVLS